LKIHIDRDMLLVELYEIRALVTEAALISDEAKEAKKKVDNLVQIISNAPQAENNSSFPRPSLRRS
jgi:hypothetical protein